MKHKKSIMIVFTIIAIMLCLSSFVSAATISGKIYDLSLEKAEDVIVEINTIPQQKVISKDGSYQFSVIPGNYNISAGLYSENFLESFASEEISIIKEGNYNLDLILFPYINTNDEFDNEMATLVPEKLFDDIEIKKSNKNLYLIIIASIFLIAILGFLLLKKRKNKEAEKSPIIQKSETLVSVTEDLQKLIEIIKKEGGRTTQKEIRKQIPLSEGKISLMITELEDKGIIKRIKKGRGNIIVLQSK